MTSALRWQTIVDFVALTMAMYLVLHWSRQARALRVTLGILALEAGALFAAYVGLIITSTILHAATIVAALILIVLFQPELRHALNRLEVTLQAGRRSGALVQGFEAISNAVFSLAAARRGALVVIARRDSVNELVQQGVPLGGQVSSEILETIFRKVSPVHDGATIVEANHITRVGAILPLSHREDLSPTWGTRHRAAMGLAERCDALVVVASEERGEVTLMHDSEFEIVHRSDELLVSLRRLISPPKASPGWHYFSRGELGLQGVAIGLAVLIWTATFLLPGDAVRVRTVPIEFTSLASGLRIADQSTSAVQVRVRGASWLLDSFGEGRLPARASLAGFGEGIHSVEIQASSLRLPAGISIDDVSPQRVTVRLTGQSTANESAGSRDNQRKK
jgi:diadenylate cyclase